MARPRVFISSTYYDLKFIRAGIDAFVRSVGYEPVLFEKGDIPFHHDKTLEQSCLSEVDSADMLVLIIGGRYGALSREDEDKLKADPEKYYSRIRSVTNAEYDKAVARDLATFIFIDQAVYSEYSTFKQNKENTEIKYAHVEDRRVFEMLDDILNRKRGNFVKSFATIEDITGWLRDQWAGIFLDLLKKKNTDLQIKGLQDQISEMNDIVASLRNFSERTLRKVDGGVEVDQFIEAETKKTWQNRIKRFAQEPLISHLVGKSLVVLNERVVWQLFLRTSDLRSFAESMSIPTDEIDKIVNDSYARYDYDKLRLQYSRMTPEDDTFEIQPV